jgi:initiation factor 1A
MPKKDKSKKTKSASEQKFPDKDPSQQQEYAEIIKFLGSNWVEVQCADGCKRRCHIRGALQRFKSGFTKMMPQDVVLISIRDAKTGDIVLKYPSDVARAMKKAGKIVIVHPEATQKEVNQTGFDFDESADPESSKTNRDDDDNNGFDFSSI